MVLDIAGYLQDYCASLGPPRPSNLTNSMPCMILSVKRLATTIGWERRVYIVHSMRALLALALAVSW